MFRKHNSTDDTQNEQQQAEKAAEEPVLLITGNSEFECMMIEGCLNEEKIPYLKKDRGTGGYMRITMGFSVFGSDYFVPSDMLDKAKECIRACDGGNIDE